MGLNKVEKQSMTQGSHRQNQVNNHLEKKEQTNIENGLQYGQLNYKI